MRPSLRPVLLILLLAGFFSPATLAGSVKDLQPPAIYHSVGPEDLVASGIFDVTHPVPWWESARFEVPEQALRRRGLTKEQIERVVLVYGGCPDSNGRRWIIADPGCIVCDASMEQRNEVANQKIPPIPSPLPKRLFVWNQAGSDRIHAVSIEETIGALGYASCCRFRQLIPRDHPSLRESNIGYQVFGEDEKPSMGWTLLPASKEQDPGDSPISARAAAISSKLKGIPLPQSHWTSGEWNLDEGIETGQLKAVIQDCSVQSVDLIQSRGPQGLLHCCLVPKTEDGPIVVGTPDGDSPQTLNVIATPGGRIWVIPPMFPSRFLGIKSCQVSWDTNQDEDPDLLLFEWEQGESYGAVLLLLDDRDLYMVLSTGGFYCP